MNLLSKHFLFLTAPLLTLGTAQAASINVDETTCTLADAITAANTDTATSACAAGSGADTITLQQDVLLTAPLPEISSSITIDGAGHKIDGQHNEAVGSVLRVASSGVLTLNNATVTGGKAADDGGGIDNNGGTVTLNSTTVSSNATGEDDGFGGGIYNNGGTLTLNSSTISSNWAYYDGGGLTNYNGTVTLTNSTVSTNVARMFGGGIENSSGTLTLNNTTLSGNQAPYGGGGGLDNYGGTVTLTNTTISDNGTEYYGGGIDMVGGTLTLRSTIVSGNPTGKEVYLESGTITADSYNVFGHKGESTEEALAGFTPGAKDLTATSNGIKPTTLGALLRPLRNNGGQAKTHALPKGSPAIDLDATCSTSLTTDQRGFSRSIGTGCDAGAFEFNPSIDIIDDRGKMAPVRTLLLN